MAKIQSSSQEKQWQAESDLRILKDAEQIKADASRMRAAQNEAKRQISAINKVAKPKSPSPKKARPNKTASKTAGMRGRKR